jgi:nucleoside-diphosphate-sugar epimerase
LHLGQIVSRQRANRLIMVGNGTSLVDTTFVDNAAQAHLDAAERLEPGCMIGGRAFFISQGDPRPIRSFVNSLLKVGGLPPVTKSLPMPAAYAAGWFLEHAYRLAGIDRMPPATRYLVLLLGRDHYFDISAARRDLGYNPSINIEEGMRLYRSALLNA